MFSLSNEPKLLLLSSVLLAAASALTIFRRRPQAPVVKKIKQRKTKGLPGGIHNVRNSCYLAATVQLLASCPDRIESFFAAKKSRIATEILILIKAVNSGTKSTPLAFIKSFSGAAAFSNDQQDAHEFLLALLNLNDKKDSALTVDNLGLRTLGCQDQKFLTPGQISTYKEELKRTFGNSNPFCGAVLSEFVCMTCTVRHRIRNISSIKVEPFTCLSIVSENSDLNAAVYEYLRVPERLSDYSHQNCRDKGAVRQKHPLLFPELLLVHLPQLHGLSGMKADAIPRLASDELSGPGYRYRLCSIIVHIGSHGSSGHFVCYRRLGHEGWILCNDALVQRVSFETVLQHTPYILLFEKE